MDAQSRAGGGQPPGTGPGDATGATPFPPREFDARTGPEVNSADSCHSGRHTTPWGAGVNLDVAITVCRRRSEVVATVAGELDAYTAPKLHHLLTDLIDDQGNLFVDVDLSGVEFLDSAALHVLVAHRRSLERRGGAFTLAGVPPIVHRILRAAGEADTFSIRRPEA
jgi:anti-sigma B factor antagonist